VIFVDTSAFFALLHRHDDNHRAATDTFGLLVHDEQLMTHNYVIVESAALAQRRLGVEAVRALHDDLLPLFDIEWVGESVHSSAYAALTSSVGLSVSLVDHVSFEIMRRRGILDAFAFDPDFAAAGFYLVPSPGPQT
jgi:predicted nucleic acid-binding protein